MKRFGAVFLGFIMAVIAMAHSDAVSAQSEPAEQPGGQGSIRTMSGGPDLVCTDVSKDSRYVEKICVDKFVLDWKADISLDEPFVRGSLHWSMFLNGGFERTDPIYGKFERDYRGLTATAGMPRPIYDALKAMRITEVNAWAPVVVSEPDWNPNPDLRHINLARMQAYDALPKRAREGRYTLPIRQVSRSHKDMFLLAYSQVYNWSELFEDRSGCIFHDPVPPDLAEQVYRYGFTLGTLQICSFTVTNLVALDNALEQTCWAWSPSSETYRQCIAKRCSSGKDVKRISPDCLVARAPTNEPFLPRDPREVNPDPKLDPAFAKLLEKALANKISGKSKGQNNPKDPLMAALGKSKQGQGAGSPRYGLSDTQWSNLQRERTADLAGLGPQFEKDKAACEDGRPSAPVRVQSFGGGLTLTRNCPCAGGVFSGPTCCPQPTAAEKREAERRRQEEETRREREYQEALANYEQELQIWAAKHKECLIDAQKSHNDRITAMKQKHAEDDKRLKEAQKLRKSLMGQ